MTGVDCFRTRIPLYISAGRKDFATGFALPRATAAPDMAKGRRSFGRRDRMRDYAVGMDVNGTSEHVTVEAEDALAAALKAKEQFPDAMITYVRKANERGDRRNPHPDLPDE